MATAQTVTEQRIILEDVRWETYERLLEDLFDRSAPRLTYSEGTLEIMGPTPEHEKLNRTIALLVEILADEVGVELGNLGSTTFRRKDVAMGFEADSCFYVQNVEAIAGKPAIDLRTDPPPDIALEIDISRSSLPKLAIFARFGVPEVWRYDGRELRMYRLSGDSYAEIEASLAFPRLPRAALARFIEESKTGSRRALLRSFREWIRTQR
jgi:Uma2 family endonuclease